MAVEKKSRNIAVWIVVTLIVAALALGLSMPQFMPSQGANGAQSLVKVHGHELNNGDWNYQFRLLATTVGGFNPKDEAQQKQVRARETALETLVEREIAYHAAEEAGMAAVVEDAEELVKKGQILSTGSSFNWRNPEEPFNYEGFRRGFVPQFMVNEKDYLEHQRRASLARTFYDSVSASAVVSEPELRAYYDSDADRLGLRTVAFAPSDYEALIEPTQAQITSYLQAHQDDLEKEYEAQKSRFQGLSPQLDLSLIAFAKGDSPNKAKNSAAALVKALRKNGSFAKLARAQSTDEKTALRGGHYGFVDLATAKSSPESIDLDPAILGALATMKPKTTSGVIEGEKDYFVLQSGGKREGDVPKEEVFQELAVKAIKADLAKARAKQEADALLTKLESGQTLAKLLEKEDGIATVEGPAAKVKANVQSVPSMARGETPPRFQGHQDLVDKAWEIGEAGKFLPEVYELGNRFVVAEVQSRDRATDEGFAEKKAELRQQLTRQRAENLLSETLQNRCQRALSQGNVAPNGVPLRQLFRYGAAGNDKEPESYNICAQVGSRGKNLRYAMMMQRFQQQMIEMQGKKAP